MKIKSNTTCPICHGYRVSYYVSCQDNFTTEEVFKLYQCDNCQLLFTKDAPTPNQMERYYSSKNYISHTNTNQGAINKIYHLVRSYMLKRKVKLVEKYSNTKKGKLVDIGAGIGLFCQAMQETNWKTIGIEPSKAAREYAQKQFNIKLETNNYWESIAAGSIDTITLWHVLEHIPNLNETLEKINQALKSNGTLILALPNYTSYDAQVYKQDWAAYDVPRHLWHFSPEGINKLLKSHSFTLKLIKRMPFDAFYISMMSEKNRGTSFPLIKGFWRGLLGGGSALFNKKASSSLIYIFKKNS